MAELPPELHEHIVSYLPNDKTLLRAYALVSKSWLAPCRRRSRIALHLTSDFESDTAFMDLLTSPLSTLPTFIDKIVISIQSKTIPTNASASDWSRQLSPLTPLMGVTSASIIQIIKFNVQSFSEALNSTLPQIMELAYFGVDFVDCEDLALSVSRFPNLKALTLGGMPRLQISSTTPLPPPPNLTRLNYLGQVSVDALQWLHGSPSSCAIDTLALSPLLHTHIPAALRTIQATALTLKRLDLRCDWDIYPHLDLSPLKRLEGLWVRGDTSASRTRARDALIRPLQTISAPLVFLEINLLNVYSTHNAESWSGMKTCLEKLTISGLKTIRFVGDRDLRRPSGDFMVEFGEWVETGLLEISDIPLPRFKTRLDADAD